MIARDLFVARIGRPQAWASRLAPGIPTIAIALVLSVQPAAAQVVDVNLWVPNGTVYAVVLSGNTIYIGGNFTFVGPATGGGVPLSAATGSLLRPFPNVDGSVYAVVPDGQGGWYVGGSF